MRDGRAWGGSPPDREGGAALIMHYGLVSDASYTPQKLAEKISSVENISKSDYGIAFGGFCDYDEKILNDLYHNGHPCAIKATTEEGRSEKWLSVMYHDDDGGIVWNPYSSEWFIAELHTVSKICSFDINEK